MATESEKRPCETCGTDFRPTKGKPGKIGQCRDCGLAEERELGIRRAVGLQGGRGKHSGATIFMNPSEGMARLVRRLNTSGFHANNGLFLGSTTSTFESRGPAKD